KGFSLVELIIVIAIMAALVAVLAPQYVKYVEKSKVTADISNLDSVLNALKIAATDVAPATGTINISGAGAITGTENAALITAAQESFTGAFSLKSNTYKTKGATIAVAVTGDAGSDAYKVTFTPSWAPTATP
ncbi:MAG: type II secretion system protein, partial [Oscillospiraceae bacterium]